MAEKKQLYIAKGNEKSNISIHDGKPEWSTEADEFSGVNWIGYLEIPNDVLEVGCYAPLTIGEAVDCRPKPVDELWVESNHSGSIRAYYGSDAGWIQGTFIPVSSLPGFQPNHRCRIAWDESGIRLIGTPERV